LLSIILPFMIETLGHYKILDRIGEGGIGEVYRARDMRLGRTVAIKVLRREIANDPVQRARFLEDARAAAALSHPNIASLDHIGDDQGQTYLVFEYASGQTLNAVVAGRPLNPRRAIEYAVQIADALADIHAQGMVHQDLKPDNIIITSKGAAKLLDVGLASWTTGGAARQQAARNAEVLDAATAVGTAAYMSPEQALGGAFDHRTDVFSLGVVLFEMLTGRLPFAVDTPGAIPLHIMQSTAPGPSVGDPTVPPEIDPIVGRMLAKSLESRYASAATVAAELRAVASILGVRSETAEIRESMPSAQSQRKALVGWLVLGVILAAVAALVWLAMQAP
jgi:eukaryotic-like serine/threonine-protein kinase